MKNITINLHQLAQLETDVLAIIADSQEKKDVKGAFKAFVNSLGEAKIKMTNVVSSTVKAIGYSHNDETLRVEYLNGSVYDYPGVPNNIFVGLAVAQSIGSYINAHIKPNYGTVQIK